MLLIYLSIWKYSSAAQSDKQDMEGEMGSNKFSGIHLN